MVTFRTNYLTETPVNLALYETLGIQTDPFSSYVAMRRDLGRHLLQLDRHYSTFPALEWVISAREAGFGLSGYRPVGLDSRMVGLFEDTLPVRGDLFGLMTLTYDDLPELRESKKLDITTEDELKKRLLIARTALEVIKLRFGDNEHLRDAIGELRILENERTSPLVSEGGIRRGVDIR